MTFPLSQLNGSSRYDGVHPAPAFELSGAPRGRCLTAVKTQQGPSATTVSQALTEAEVEYPLVSVLGTPCANTHQRGVGVCSSQEEAV